MDSTWQRPRAPAPPSSSESDLIIDGIRQETSGQVLEDHPDLRRQCGEVLASIPITVARPANRPP
jgi:hypothetical protein